MSVVLPSTILSSLPFLFAFSCLHSLLLFNPLNFLVSLFSAQFFLSSFLRSNLLSFLSLIHSIRLFLFYLFFFLSLYLIHILLSHFSLPLPFLLEDL